MFAQPTYWLFNVFCVYTIVYLCDDTTKVMTVFTMEIMEWLCIIGFGRKTLSGLPLNLSQNPDNNNNDVLLIFYNWKSWLFLVSTFMNKDKKVMPLLASSAHHIDKLLLNQWLQGFAWSLVSVKKLKEILQSTTRVLKSKLH